MCGTSWSATSRSCTCHPCSIATCESATTSASWSTQRWEYQLDTLDFQLVELRYDAIPELYPDQVCALLQRQREGVITRLEEAQLTKYRFQNAILAVQPQ